MTLDGQRAIVQWCSTRRNSIEVSIRSTEQLAAIATLGGRLNTLGEEWPNGYTWARWNTYDDGTVFDRITGLQWGRKTDNGSIHDKDDLHTWSTGSPWQPDGTAFTVFLAALNTEACFAGYCDWRLPTIDELQSLNEAPSGGCGGEEPVLLVAGCHGRRRRLLVHDRWRDECREVTAWWPRPPWHVRDREGQRGPRARRPRRRVPDGSARAGVRPLPTRERASCGRGFQPDSLSASQSGGLAAWSRWCGTDALELNERPPFVPTTHSLGQP